MYWLVISVDLLGKSKQQNKDPAGASVIEGDAIRGGELGCEGREGRDPSFSSAFEGILA